MNSIFGIRLAIDVDPSLNIFIKITILQILESFKSKCSKSNLFKYLKNGFYEVHFSNINSHESHFHVYSWSNHDSCINNVVRTARLSGDPSSCPRLWLIPPSLMHIFLIEFNEHFIIPHYKHITDLELFNFHKKFISYQNRDIDKTLSIWKSVKRKFLKVHFESISPLSIIFSF